MELKVYHDPVKDDIVLETGNPDVAIFRLFDAIGNLLLSKNVSNHERISAVHMEAGLYLYKLIAGDKLQAGKIWLNR